MTRHRVHLAFALSLLAAPATAVAESPNVCAPTDSIDKFRLLRQLSLDLRGRIPTVEEYEALEMKDEVSEEDIKTMLESDEFGAQIRQYHAGLLYSSLAAVPNLVHLHRQLLVDGNGLWWAFDNPYRGGQVGCLNVPQTQFDAAGRPIPIEPSSALDGYPSCVTSTGAPNGNCRREGYVLVNPYWAPDTQIKVCAYDAQALSAGYNGRACDATNLADLGCGCGPNLQYCLPSPGSSPEAFLLRVALAEEGPRLFETIVRDRRPYFEALTTPDTVVNGKTAHYYRFMSGGGVAAQRVDMGNVPAIAYTDATWHRVTRAPHHSGVLTTLAYTMRFASHRARANRFYTAFLCKPFVSSEQLPPSTDACSQNPNLSERCGCKGCHTTLEPAAAHWSRWYNMNEFGYLPSESLPAYDASCAACGEGTGVPCPPSCERWYMTRNNTKHPDAIAKWLGHLQTRAWLTDEQAKAIDNGPRALVQREGNERAMAECTVRHVAENMLNRELTDEEMLEWVPAMADHFAATSYDFAALVEELVGTSLYRTIR